MRTHDMRNLIDKLFSDHDLTDPEFLDLLRNLSEDDELYLYERARAMTFSMLAKANGNVCL